MMQVWFFFRILETLLGTLCMIYHSQGFQNKEPIKHYMLFCGTFFGFTLLSFKGLIGIAVGGAPPALVEFFMNLCATVMYITASIVSMHYAENDFHLMYLSDFEEPLHPYFANCRAQSIAALATGSVHLLHCVLALDVVFSTKRESKLFESPLKLEEDIPVPGEVKLYLLGKLIENKLRRNAWFDNMCRRPAGPLTIYSMLPFSGRHTTRNTTIAHDVEKNRTYKPNIRNLIRHENPDSITSEELKNALDYSDYRSPPESRPLEIVNDKKDPNTSNESIKQKVPLTHFAELPEEFSTQPPPKQTSQFKKSILKKDFEDSKIDLSVADQDFPKQGHSAQLQRSVSTIELKTLLNADPRQSTAESSEVIQPPLVQHESLEEENKETKPEQSYETSELSPVKRTTSQEYLLALLKGVATKKKELSDHPSDNDTSVSQSSLEAFQKEELEESQKPFSDAHSSQSSKGSIRNTFKTTLSELLQKGLEPQLEPEPKPQPEQLQESQSQPQPTSAQPIGKRSGPKIETATQTAKIYSDEPYNESSMSSLDNKAKPNNKSTKEQRDKRTKGGSNDNNTVNQEIASQPTTSASRTHKQNASKHELSPQLSLSKINLTNRVPKLSEHGSSTHENQMSDITLQNNIQDTQKPNTWQGVAPSTESKLPESLASLPKEGGPSRISASFEEESTRLTIQEPQPTPPPIPQKPLSSSREGLFNQTSRVSQLPVASNAHEINESATRISLSTHETTKQSIDYAYELALQKPRIRKRQKSNVPKVDVAQQTSREFEELETEQMSKPTQPKSQKPLPTFKDELSHQKRTSNDPSAGTSQQSSSQYSSDETDVKREDRKDESKL